MVLRALKGLDGMISHSVVHWRMEDPSWHFAPALGVIADPIHNADFLREV